MAKHERTMIYKTPCSVTLVSVITRYNVVVIYVLYFLDSTVLM